jgi:hypothetical protein
MARGPTRPRTAKPGRKPLAEASGYIPPPSRQGKKALLTHHDPTVLRKLKQLALDQNTTQQRLLGEALTLLFTKYSVSPVA